MGHWDITEQLAHIKSAQDDELIKQKLNSLDWMHIPTHTVTRIEVIDQRGRVFARHLREGEVMSVSMQDDNRTMKIFIDDK